ncbi:MAG: circularly permuted type 2 ATP-grasp protein [Bacteroidota bacterium]
MNQYSFIPGEMANQVIQSSGHDLQQYAHEVLANSDPNWQTFFSSFAKLGKEEIENRKQDIQRLLKENGVTYNIYGDPSGENRSWSLDLIPFLIDKKEWDFTEKGLVQRAELLNLILQDIYGERRLMKDGILPLDLVYNHRGFLRQCEGMMKKPRKHSLVLYSANIARSADNRVWIISDRTQAPSGSGYALENRTAFARMMPELFTGLKVRHLSPYFESLTQALTEINPRQLSNPRVVILTPGPGNETYFEHSYLASYLGFALVQGNDLMVKDNCVWLKTLGGLERVDVILRRVDDIYCDPLELKEDSVLGVPGLLQAIRSGNVSLANPLGSGILESPGLMPFMNSASKYLLGEDLIIPNIASWWCGQQKEMNYVLSNISKLVIKKIHRDTLGSSAIDGSSLSIEQQQELKLNIQQKPYLYVGQEKVNFSATPALVNGNIQPRNALFRTFLVSSNGQYTAMKGGLTRTAADNKDFVISNQLGGMSKDTWILSPEPEQQSIAKKSFVAGNAINSGVLPSHTAENLFWVGRYVERFLGNARFLRTILQFVSEGNRMLSDNDLQTEKRLLQALTHYSFTYPGFLLEEPGFSFEDPWPELRSVMMDMDRSGSLFSNFHLFSRAVYAVRDPWSTDTWRVLRSMEDECAAITDKSAISHIKMQNVLDNMITAVVAFIGLNRESISREQGWMMMDIGRKIEQCQLLISMLRATLVNKTDEQVAFNLQEAVLKSHESLVNYRYKYKAHIQLPLVLDLLLFDPTNPRSLIFQVERLKAYMDVLPKTTVSKKLTGHERVVFEAYTILRLSDKDELCKVDYESGQFKKLDEMLEQLYGMLGTVPVSISKTYFKHAQEPRQLFITETI